MVEFLKICYNVAMNTYLIRCCLSFLLMIAITLQGFAASSATLDGTSRCGMSELEMLKAHHGSGQTANVDQTNQMANDVTDAASADMPGCKHCTQHCISANFNVITNDLGFTPAASGHGVEFPAPILALPIAPVHSLERPPRA